LRPTVLWGYTSQASITRGGEMKLTVVLLVALFINVPVFAQDSGSIGFNSVPEAYAALRKEAGAEFSNQGGWIIANVKEGPHSGIWSFTPNTHPTHPAVIKRTVVEADGKISISMRALCEAAKPACDQLVDDFKKLNDQIRRDFQSRSKSK